MQRHKGLLSSRATELLTEVGSNIDLARTRRRLTVKSVCSRAGITAQTYKRLVEGEAGVTLAVLLGVLSALDLEEDFATVASPALDKVGISLERAAKPVRIRNGEDDGLEVDF